MTSQTTPQRSALHASHAALGARFQECYGWELPQHYTDPAAEYHAATHGAAVHDHSCAGRLQATGKDALDLLHRLSTNQVLGLAPGQGAPTILTTDRGRILDLVAVVNAGDYVLLLTSPGMQHAVVQWLDKYTIMEDLTVTDLTASTTMLTVLGPESRAALERAMRLDLSGLAPFATTLGLAGMPPAQGTASTLGLTASTTGPVADHQVRIVHRPLGALPSYDLVLAAEAAPAVWQGLQEAGLTPMGLAAYEALRVVQGVPAHGPSPLGLAGMPPAQGTASTEGHGHELGDDYNPLEAGLMGAISFTKGCYIGQEVIARLDTYQRVQKRLVMLRFPPQAQATPGAALKRDGQTVGSVTSVARAPDSGEVVGLGYVRVAAATVGTWLELVLPGKDVQGWAEVTGLPLLFGPGGG
jgi:folate-binding protein YgfZ